jgi:adenylate cyclase
MFQKLMDWIYTHSLRLRVGLFIMLAFGIIIFTVLVAGYMYYQHTLITRNVGREMIAQSSKAVVKGVADEFVPIVQAVQATAALGHIAPQYMRKKSFQRYLFQIIENNPRITSFYTGVESDGSFVQALRLAEGSIAFGPANLPAPQGARFMRRFVDGSSAGGQDKYEYFSDWDGVMRTENAPITYDPRKRPFYRDAVADPSNVVMTDVYPFASTGKAGVTISTVITSSGSLLGVVGADMTLDSLTRLMKDYRVGKEGVSVLLDNQGQVLAHSGQALALRTQGQTVTLPRIADVGDALLSKIDSLGLLGKAGDFDVAHPTSHARWLGAVHPFPTFLGKQWYIVTVVPESEFIGDMREASQGILLIALMFVLLGLLAATWFSHYISRHIELVITETERIRKLDLNTPTEPIRTIITEIRQLMAAVEDMKATVRDFTRYVPLSLVRQLMAQRISSKPGGHSRFLTVMFTDLENFSSLSEALPTNEVATIVSRYLEAVSREIELQNGTLAKFIGDGIMAFWGAPALDEKHALHACVAALRSKLSLDRLNEQLIAEGKPSVFCRFGIHADSVLVGNMGYEERLDYTVMGDGVNVASRLESINKQYGTQICVSHAVYQDVGESLLLRPLGRVTVKGRQAPVVVYELLAIRGADSTDIGVTPRQERLADLTKRGFQAWQSGDKTSALQYYVQILREYPEDPVARRFLMDNRADSAAVTATN